MSAASLELWDLDSEGYEGAKKRKALAPLVQALQTQTSSSLDLSDDQWDLCRKWDDVIDSLIASLTARAHHVQGKPDIPTNQAGPTEKEGWIILPNGQLSDLPRPC